MYLRLGLDELCLSLDDLGLVLRRGVDGNGRAERRQGADRGIGAPGYAPGQITFAVLVDDLCLKAAVPEGVDREVVEVRVDVGH